MSVLARAVAGTRAFLVDYIARHSHPANAVLHLAGVPMAFAGLYFVLAGRFGQGVLLLTGGYLLQYLGHKAQGNEVGEVTLIKAVWRRLTAGGRASSG
jgi:hypothetical protein